MRTRDDRRRSAAAGPCRATAGRISRAASGKPCTGLPCELLHGKADGRRNAPDDAFHVRPRRVVEETSEHEAPAELPAELRCVDVSRPPFEAEVVFAERVRQEWRSDRAVLDGLRDPLAAQDVDARCLADQQGPWARDRLAELEAPLGELPYLVAGEVEPCAGEVVAEPFPRVVASPVEDAVDPTAHLALSRDEGGEVPRVAGQAVKREVEVGGARQVARDTLGVDLDGLSAQSPPRQSHVAPHDARHSVGSDDGSCPRGPLPT